jgi:signal transduction histidine kinase
MIFRRRLLLFQVATLVAVQGASALAVYVVLHRFDGLQQYRALFGLMLLVLGLGLIVTVVGEVVVARSIARPLEALTAAARRIAGGDCTPPAAPPQRDEIGLLSQAMAHMATALGARNAAMREAAAALAQARDEAVRANNAKSMFLANMSHELRTPLNAVIGFGELIDRQMLGPVGTPKYREYARYIHQSGTHLLALIEEILDLAKVEAGQLVLEKARLQPHKLLEESLTMLRPAVEAAQLRLDVAGDPHGWPAFDGDPVKLKQVFVNLIGNAIKFTPAGGRITVAGDIGRSGEFCLRISDTGIGMRAEDIPLVVQPFYRVRCSLDARHAGAGLGLPFAKAVVELHGGSLGIVSDLGRGTTVTVILPVAALAPPARVDAAA